MVSDYTVGAVPVQSPAKDGEDTMNLLTKAYYLTLIAKVRLTWGRHNSHYTFRVPGNPKFMGALDAARMIPDGAVLATSGLAGNQRPSILYWAIRETFQETGHPRGLTIMSTGGQGGRGRAPGTVEEIMLKDLCARIVTGHFETFKAGLRLAEEGVAELQCVPQGMLALLLEAQGDGVDSLLTSNGVHTLVDPRTGYGTVLAGENAEQLVAVEDDQLRFRIPKVTVAVFNAYAADREGNIYITHCPMRAEMREITRAARRNGGLVIVNVSRVVEKGSDDIFLPAESIDAVVVHPRTEQSGYIRYRKQFTYLTTKGTMRTGEGIARARFVNTIMGLTPRRGEIDQIIARLAADTFVKNVPEGALVNIGVGMPEEVCRVLYMAGILDHVTLFTESGVIGGVPAPGIFFGAAIGAKKVISSAETFRMCAERLDATVLGVLQADSGGNVNVSKRTDKLRNYVGPGGFIDLTSAAKTVLFVTKWMEGEKVAMQAGKLRYLQRGKVKFGDGVDEVTMNGAEALKAGKKVFFATTVGLFQLTGRGMELRRIMPGLDLQKDILETTTMKIVLPNGTVPEVDSSILTGKGYQLKMG